MVVIHNRTSLLVMEDHIGVTERAISCACLSLIVAIDANELLFTRDKNDVVIQVQYRF